VTQQKTGRPVQFELLEAARSSLQVWLERRGGTVEDYAFPSRTDHTPSYRHAAVCQAGERVGDSHRATARGLRHALAQADQSFHHLQSHRQLAGGAAVGAAAQIPCAYCVYAHTKATKAAGATDAQIKEAISTAVLVRFNSTMLNGSDGGVEWQPQRK
jgi:AhpD family alkylhydroperoxidase